MFASACELTIEGGHDWYNMPGHINDSRLFDALIVEWESTVRSTDRLETYLNMKIERTPGQTLDLPNDPLIGGRKTRAVTRVTTKWISTGRKITMRDGSTRSLYKNAAKPGEHRIRRMATRAGKSVATYVKPPR